MLNNLFSGHNLRGIKKSLNKEFKDWLVRENKNIYVYGEKAPISMKIEIGTRFHVLTKNSSVIIVHYNNMLQFLETFHLSDQRALIQFMRAEKTNFICQMGTVSILFRALIIPFWSLMSKNQTKEVYYSSINNFTDACYLIMAASDPLIKLLEMGKINQPDSLYQLVCNKMNEIMIDDEKREEMKQLVILGVNSCLDYLNKITAGKELTTSEDTDLILSTNANVERLFGLMKASEPTKFNLKPELFSALNCSKFNRCLEILSARDDWNAILDKATISTKEYVEAILASEQLALNIRNSQLRELEKKRQEEENELNRETELILMNPEIVPVDKKDLTGESFAKWKFLSREFQAGKDRRSLNKNLFEKSMISYFYKGRFNLKTGLYVLKYKI